MEDSSEGLNAGGSSNLRDLIMQKLSAAREQKLKQNRSTNNLLGTNKTVPTWEVEKQALTSLIDKNQKIVAQLNEDKKNLEVINEDLLEKVKILTNENRELKIDLEKIKKDKNDKGNLEDPRKLEAIIHEKDRKIREEAKKNLILEEKVLELAENLKEKEKDLDKYKKGRNSRGLNEKVAQNLADFKADKEKLDRILDKNLVRDPNEELKKLRSQLASLQESKDSKEKDLKDQISQILQENQKLKQKLENDRKDESSTSKSETKSYETLTSLELSLEKLKEEPKDNKLLLSTYKDFQDFYSRQKSIDELHFSELIQKNAEISSLLNEISELRQRLLIFESKKYENELSMVRGDLHKAIAERMHAKKLIICYIRNVQQLEKIINDRIGPDELDQLSKLELSRLNEENKSLVESKLKQEEFHKDEVKKLQETVDQLNSKVRELESKLDLFQKNRIKENNEEMKSWLIRNRQVQEISKKLVDSLGNIETKSQTTGKKRGAKEAVKIH